MTSAWEDPEKSLAKAGPLIRNAANGGAGIIIFPEQFATGWDPASRTHIEKIDGFIINSLREFARDAGICVIGSFRERSGPHPRNTAVVIGRDGSLLTSYSKVHLFSPAGEDKAFAAGTELGTFSLGPLKCGVAICYDLRFPELFGAYAARGVQAVFIPAAWPASRIRHWELFISARAAENQMYVAGVNTTGVTPVDSYAGATMVADPHGTIIVRAGDTEQLIFAEMDPEIVDSARSSFPVKKDRRNELYRTLAGQ